MADKDNKQWQRAATDGGADKAAGNSYFYSIRLSWIAATAQPQPELEAQEYNEW